MRAARRSLVVLLLSAGLAGASAAQDDPLAMVVEARECLERGDAARAAVLADRAAALIDADAGWDPDGSIASRILPSLRARIGRMREALAALDRLMQSPSPEPGKAPMPTDARGLFGLVKAELESAARRRAGMDEIATRLPAGPERGAIMQSQPWSRAAVQGPAAGLEELEAALRPPLRPAAPEPDETVKALRTRLDAMKREVIALSVEKEELDAALDTARRNRHEEQTRIVEFIGYDPEGLTAVEAAGLNELGAALAHRLRDRLEEVRTMQGQSLLQKMLYVEELDRFRLANAISVSEGSRDLAVRIEALSSAIEAVPVTDEGLPDPTMGWLSCCLTICRR